ncbi:MAG: hypothetical protein ACI87A_001191, partial [Planctomycetota bacterium]
MNSRLATIDSNTLVPELSLGEFRTVTRQVGRLRNGANRNVGKQSKTESKAKPKARTSRAASVASNRNSNPNAGFISNGKPTYVDPNEPKLVTKSGRVPHSARPSVSDSHGVHVTVKLRSGIPNLRKKHVIESLERCFSKGKDRFEFELNAYTVMSNHFYFLARIIHEPRGKTPRIGSCWHFADTCPRRRPCKVVEDA